MDQNLFQGPVETLMDSRISGHHLGMSNPDPGQVWQNTSRPQVNFNMKMPVGASPAAYSAQKDIVNRRGDRVSEKFGQITPPEESKQQSATAQSANEPLEDQTSQEDGIAKQKRTERARNAANKRHSKSKASRKDSIQNEEEDADEGGNDRNKSTSLQREKNRVAAAKCRAKKKANSEVMQETHRDESRRNSDLQREMRALRDQKAFLRNSLLQHEPGVCQCHAIHRFNMAQAQQLAFGVGAMGGHPMSPSQESIGSVQTPSSNASRGKMHRSLGSMGDSRRMSMVSMPQSFNGPSNYTFGQITSPDPTLLVSATAQDPSQMPPQFADFLHGSPDGRSRFS